jgi:hypothetical protein
MNALEEQADNAKARDLSWKPLSWLGTIRPTSANDAFNPALWETFVCPTLGLEVPVLSSLPRLHNSPLAKCGCKKHAMGEKVSFINMDFVRRLQARGVFSLINGTFSPRVQLTQVQPKRMIGC